MRKFVRPLVMAFALSGSVTLAAGGNAAADEIRLSPARPQPSPESLAQGLSVYYAYADVGETNELETAKAWLDRAENPTSDVLTHLAFENGPTTLTSGKGPHTLAQIDGYLKLTKGSHTYTIWSNDGVGVLLGGADIYVDSSRHPCDNMLGPVTIDVPEDAWYEISITYFNRNGTSCLMIEQNDAPISPELLAHAKP